MLTQEEIKLFQKDGLTFEQIQQISDSHDAVERGEVISMEESKNKFLNYRKNIENKKTSLYV